MCFVKNKKQNKEKQIKKYKLTLDYLCIFGIIIMESYKICFQIL